MTEDRDLLFARRLVALGDIVFGFSLAQLALHLTRPKTPADLIGHSFEFFGFFGTFALIFVFWIVFHRANLYVRRATLPILGATFVALAAVAVLPFTLDLYFHFGIDPIAAGAYAASFAAFFGANAVILGLGERQTRADIDVEEDRSVRERIWRWAFVAIIFGLSLALMPVNLYLGVYTWSLVGIAMAIIRRRFRSSAVLPKQGGRVEPGGR